MSKLRLELCSECCFDCVFCHHDQVNMTDTENKKLDASDYGFLCKVGKLCGFNQVLLSGGEPLIRKDINEIMSNIKDSGMTLQMTSNGYLLSNVKDKTLIDSINISIHSLDLKSPLSFSRDNEFFLFFNKYSTSAKSVAPSLL